MPCRRGCGWPKRVAATTRIPPARSRRRFDAARSAAHWVTMSCARGRLLLQGMVSLHRGDLRGGIALAMEAERHAKSSQGTVARAELAALKAQISFFTGSYADALRHAQLAVDQADTAQDLALRVFARRATCPIFGNVEVPDLRQPDRADARAHDRERGLWEEAISRNDLACYLPAAGRAGRSRKRARASDLRRRTGSTAPMPLRWE